MTATVDALVRAVPASDRDITKHMRPPFRNLPMGHAFGHRYVPPIDDIHPDVGAGSDYAGHASGRQVLVERRPGADTRYTDPNLAGEDLLERRGTGTAIVMAPNRLLRADWRHEVAIMRATNDWLRETWLASRHGPCLRASIHLVTANVPAAVEEIERCAKEPGFVQVALPMHVHAPYGDERYFPLFEAAVRHRLPVAIHGDGSGGIEMPPTMAGLAHHFVEYHTLFPLNGVIHLGSMISEGLFDRLPDLRVVFTDGGFAVFTPLLWREDAKARALKDEMPWVAGRPSDYVRQNVRFVLRRDDIPADAAHLRTALDLAVARETLLYGSNYPMWDMVEREPAPVPDDGGLRDAFFGQTALASYPRLNG